MLTIFGDYRWRTETWHSAAFFAYDTYEEILCRCLNMEDACSGVPFYFIFYQLLALSIHPILIYLDIGGALLEKGGT